jgi:hypothetical protein
VSAPTFKQHRDALLTYLAANGWDVHLRSAQGKDLKVPYATRGETRLNFRRQAIYHGEHSLTESSKEFADGEALVKAAEFRSKQIASR